MAWVDRLKARKLQVAMALGLAVGVVIGLFLPIRAAAPTDADTAQWSLPTAQSLQRFRDDQFRGLQSARFWGELARPGRRARQDTQTAWTLHAIVTRPQVQVAIGSPGKTEQKWLRLGDTLPDGSRLVNVSRDRVQYEKDGCRQSRDLYPSDPNKAASQASGCGATPTDPVASPAPQPRVRRGA